MEILGIMELCAGWHCKFFDGPAQDVDLSGWGGIFSVLYIRPYSHRKNHFSWERFAWISVLDDGYPFSWRNPANFDWGYWRIHRSSRDGSKSEADLYCGPGLSKRFRGNGLVAQREYGTMPVCSRKGTLKSVYASVLAELPVVFRFAIVGLSATAVHMGMIFLLITRMAVHPVGANAAAFLTAFMVSFLGHLHWSFTRARSRRQAFPRFLLTALSAFALNNIMLVWLLQLRLLPDLVSTMLAVFIIPLYTFLLSRFWAFR